MVRHTAKEYNGTIILPCNYEWDGENLKLTIPDITQMKEIRASIEFDDA